MKGLEIIERIAIEQAPHWITVCLAFGVFSISIPTFLVYRFTKNGNKAFLTEVISGVIYFVFLIVVLETGTFEKPTGEYQYKVRITEDVRYVEFTDKYEVITENDDGTYIIQEKNRIK